MDIKDIFNPETLNIFTDASIKTIKNIDETLGCPGAICVGTNLNGSTYIIDEAYFIERHATNNSSEIKAVSLGISKALQYRNNFKYINLFSDSMICIHGLREWLYNWLRCIYNGTMYSSSGKPVANQQTFASILNTIVMNNLYINLYHQKGHVSVINNDSLINAANVFKKTNFIQDDISLDLISLLSGYNNMVDIRTGEQLENFVSRPIPYCNKFNKDSLVMGFDMVHFNVEKYKELTYNKIIGR